MPPIRTLMILTAATSLLAACTDAGLQPIPPPPPPSVDNKLTIYGEVCAEPPATTPFPVKILFILDQSNSLQCTDSNNRRFDALNKVITDLMPLPNVYFGFVGFASWSRKQGFTRSPDALAPFLDPGQGLGPATDYQGSLASAVQILEQDMVLAGPGERARTRYVVLFVSDGSPEPRCRPGCEDTRTACSDGVDNDGDGITDGSDPDCADVNDNSLSPDNLYPVCNTDLEIEDGTYVDMQGRCPEYNMPQQIMQRIDDLRALEQLYSAGDISLHTLLIFSPQETVEAICPGASEQFGYSADLARDLLAGMAEAGGGTFRDVNVEDADDSFLDLDFTALTSPYFITAFSAYNQSAVASPNGPVPDSDRDGLGDEDEIALGTKRHEVDSDAREDGARDGYTDLFELRLSDRGFSPTSPDAPAIACGELDDTDGDGLRDCEERFLGTDPRLPDTDGDRIVDGVELRMGLDPVEVDDEGDPDLDGILNREEVRAGTDPLIADEALYRSRSMRYSLEDTGQRLIPEATSGDLELRRCYDFELADIELVITDKPQDTGRNRILLQVFSEPIGLSGGRAIIRQACVEARYLGQTHKEPHDGLADVSADGWRSLRRDLTARLGRVEACLELEEGVEMTRADVEGVLEECLPHRIQLERTLYDRVDLLEILQGYIAWDLTLKLPLEASDFFVPIELFDPEVHCHRPWEINRLELLLTAIEEAACGACDGLQGVVGGRDAGVDGGAP